MKFLKKMILILILIIIIICIVIALYLRQNKANNSNEESNVIVGNDSTAQNSDQFMAITECDYYFYVNEIGKNVTNAIMEINQNSSEGLIYFKNVIDSKDEISDKDIVLFANSYKDSKYVFYMDEVYDINLSDNVELFYVKAKINSKDFNFITKVDFYNDTYTVFLYDYLEKNNLNINSTKSNIDISGDSIDINDNNEVVVDSKTSIDIAKEYLYLIKCNLVFNLEKEYNSLDNEYKEKKFNSYDDFVKYANVIKEDILNSSLSKYKVENKDNNAIYTLLDDRGRYYFIEISNYELLNYSVKLDDYTVLSDDFKEAYSKASNEQKASADVEMFIKMINNKDYNFAYNCLNDNFKNNYFNTEEKFENYVKSKFYDYNILSTTSNIIESDGYYTCTVTLKNSVAVSALTMDKDFIVKIDDDTNFEMSFNVN